MEQSAAKKARPLEKIPALTSLRFFAALYVVFFHVIASYLPWTEQKPVISQVLGLGYASVSFFFLLSGYILAVVYLRRGTPVASAPFYWARFARVYPLFFLTLVLDTPFLFLSRWTTYGLKLAVLKTSVTFTGNVLMLQAWGLPLRGIDNPNWSLSVETLFYLTFPLLGVALWKLRGWRLWLSAALLYLGGQAIVYVLAQHIGGDFSWLFPPLHLTTFALGILVARWQHLQKDRADGARRRSSPALLSLLTLLALAGFGLVAWWSPGRNSNVYDGLLAPIFAIIVWVFSHSDWRPAKLLSASWLVVLGESSFGLYLIHLPVFHAFQKLGWDRAPWLFPVYLGTAIALSVVSFYCFETPVRRWLLKSTRTHVKETMQMASDAQ